MAKAGDTSENRLADAPIGLRPDLHMTTRLRVCQTIEQVPRFMRLTYCGFRGGRLAADGRSKRRFRFWD